FGYRVNDTIYDRKDFAAAGEAFGSLDPAIGNRPRLLSITLNYFSFIGNFHEYTIGIQVPLAMVRPGTFTIASDSTGFVSAFYDRDTATYLATSATITLVSVDTVNNLVSGTFRMTVADYFDPSQSLQIEAGYFNDIPIAAGAYDPGTITANANASFFTTKSTPNAVEAYQFSGSNTLYIDAYDNDSGIEREISIELYEVRPGTYNFGSQLGPITPVAAYHTLGASPDVQIQTDDGAGQLIISQVDAVNHRLFGRFNFTGTDYFSGETVQISGGVINNLEWFVL